MRGANAILSLSIERNPIMIDNTILKPLSLLSIIPSASLLLPSDEGAKLDIQIATMLAYSFFMMILSDFIPPYDESSKPQLGELVFLLAFLTIQISLCSRIMQHTSHYRDIGCKNGVRLLQIDFSLFSFTLRKL